MQNWKKLLMISLFFFNLQTIYCCQTFYKTSFSADREYIFYGEITGYTEAHESKKVRNEIYGLKIKVTKLIFGKREIEELDLFPYTVGMSCNFWGLSLENLKKKFPVNKIIRASGIQDLVYIEEKDGRLKLGHLDYFDLSFVEKETNPIKANYKKLRRKIRRVAKKENYQIREKYFKEILFNVRIDLARLSKVEKESKKLKIIKRIVSSNLGFRRRDFDRIVEDDIILEKIGVKIAKLSLKTRKQNERKEKKEERRERREYWK